LVSLLETQKLEKAKIKNKTGAKEFIINQLRQIKTELSRVIISGLSANKISNASVENINIQNSSLLATIRGKVSR